jgi:hypothetical protein
MEERPLSPVPKRLMAVLGLLLTLLLIWWCLFSIRRDPLRGLYYVLLLPVLLWVIRYFYYHRRRCPECGNRLVLRREPIEGKSWRYRMMLDCSHCRIAWNTGHVEDDSAVS